MKTTEEHFEIFKSECLKWIDIFGLKDYEVHFEHSDKVVEKGNIAVKDSNFQSRISRLSFCETWPEGSMCPLNDEEVKVSAFEEVCHLLLGEFRYIAECRYINDGELSSAEHAIIRTLQNILYPKYKEVKS